MDLPGTVRLAAEAAAAVACAIVKEEDAIIKGDAIIKRSKVRHKTRAVGRMRIIIHRCTPHLLSAAKAALLACLEKNGVDPW
jgi:hypothetical protein